MKYRRLLPLLLILVLATGCRTPHLPPTTVPTPASTAFDPFTQVLQRYVDQTQPYRKQAAVQAESLPAKEKTGADAESSVRTRQNSLADALRTRIRPDAHQGELFTPEVSAAFTKTIADAFASPKRDLIVDELTEQNEGERPAPTTIAINQPLKAPRVPPLLSEQLPPLPKQLEYDFLGRALILRDTDADVVVDYLADALPANPSASTPPPSTAPSPAGASFLPIPDVRGGTVFVLIGDSGSGDEAQQAVADAMVRYFTTARHFGHVLMLGDNLYDDDYTGEFMTPYKPLLDRGVTFHAAIGNHDRDLQIHFKPFNMRDRDFYTFDEGNARFAVLNSNHPDDPRQLEWLDGVFKDAQTKWRIAFFHHPLYSSGQHAAQSRDVIRPALEPALVRNGVNVVFSGHEHLYERISPQKGIRYFVSGGGGRYLYNVSRSPFDEVAVSDHHFMVINIAGDTMYYEAVRPNGSTIDCGIEWRTAEARAKGADKTGQEWLAKCEAATAARTTQQ